MTDETQQLDEQPTAAETYAALRRHLRRREGFGLVFVRCAPAEVADIVARLRGDLPSKRMELLALESAVEDLYDCIEQEFEDAAALDVLFVTGLEKSLVDDIRPGIGGQGDYYNEDIMPRVLGNLNLRREQFRDELNCCLVLFGPMFAKKYLLRRAQDFFDWRTSIYEFPMQAEMLEQLYWQVWLEGDYKAYCELSTAERKAKILEIKDLLEEPHQKIKRRHDLLLELGSLFTADGVYEEAIQSFDRALKIRPDYSNTWIAWNDRGRALFNLGKHEEAIQSFDRALEIRPDYYNAWNDRGRALFNLGKYEEAIQSFDRALKLKPNRHDVWNNQGISLGNLGKYEEAIQSFDRSLEIEPDRYDVWRNRGRVLEKIGKYEAAIRSFDRALEIKPDYHDVWHDKSIALACFGKYEEAIQSSDRALGFKPDKYEAWYNRGTALVNLGKYEEAIQSFDRALEIKPNDYQSLFAKSQTLFKWGRWEEGVEVANELQEIAPDYVAQKNREAWIGFLDRFGITKIINFFRRKP